ncbi:rhi-1 [Pristionchus pacificus]|uniref:Rhi-1 n=1 Tax=Pristionchus pacificus TaxID=54126 RepID=A0A2A6D0V7_PRIPA|nr:rhi-1 [Pristionchus pacificus]|eukprot:PDM84112.1 rhi-1 [Pristionchus pacificus]
MSDDLSDVAADSSHYKPPEKKSIDEILKNTDGCDESLGKYKGFLLDATDPANMYDPEDPRSVILVNISLLVDTQPKISIDLNSTVRMDDIVFRIKEGAQYQLQLNFFVQREIVTGLKYIHKVYKHGIPVDKDSFMIGSYAPKKDLQRYATPPEDAPSGMINRGKYKVKSRITDDYGHDWLTWVWHLEIAKDW